MASETMRVVARISAKPDKVAELKSVLLSLIGPTRMEKGCISYQLCESKTDAGDFVFVEEWASAAAINAHMTTAHVQEAFAKAQSLLASPPDIRVYSIIG
jgi:quinol monooxygenase YgiN